MKAFQRLDWSANQCRAELVAFRRLLASAPELGERVVILPFFQNSPHLSAFFGSYDPDVTQFDLFAHEYDLFGDFKCDLVAGDSATKHFVFVEFEDAALNSVFVKRKATPEWAPRFEHGYSQIVDWFWKLQDQEKTRDYGDRFGAGMRYSGLLVVGRTEPLEPREIRRLAWREEFCPANSRRIRCRTFDQLADDLERRLATYSQAMVGAAGRAHKPTENAAGDKPRGQDLG